MAGLQTAVAAETFPRSQARIAGVFYLLNIITGSLALVFYGRKLAVYGNAAILISTACYVAVTLLFFKIFKPVDSKLSLLAAFFSLVGCGVGALSPFHLLPGYINSLEFFGVYCLLIGYLISKSTFLPRILGMLMGFGGLGWLTFLSLPLRKQLSPYNLIPGIVAEVALTVWLLAVGVNVQKWMEQDNLRSAGISTAK
jgi:Domain of unknown function (DUF4386)